MASETLRDYLGHPCAVAEARERFSEPLKQARSLESRELVRQIGRLINEIATRGMHQGEALRLARDCAEDDGLAGVLSMAHEYDLKSGNTFCELAGLVLQALERGKLMEASNG